MENESNESKLIDAAFSGNVGEVKALLAVPGIDVNAEDINGRSALMLAAGGGRTAIVQDLLAFQPQDGQPGINVNARDKNGWSALMMAARGGHTEMIKSLLAFPGIDVNEAKDEYGRTALILAVSSRSTEVVRVLLAFPGIDVNIRDNNGDTALEYARRRGAKENVGLITKYQATKKIGDFIEKNLEHVRWRPPNEKTGDPGGREYQKLVSKSLENPIYKKPEEGGTRGRKTKKTKKLRRTKKSRKTRRKPKEGNRKSY